MNKKLHDLTWADYNSPRYLRAKLFTSQIINLMRDYIPQACLRQVEKYLMEIAYEADVQIVNVAPDYDMKQDLKRKEAMSKGPKPIIIKDKL